MTIHFEKTSLFSLKNNLDKTTTTNNNNKKATTKYFNVSSAEVVIWALRVIIVLQMKMTSYMPSTITFITSLNMTSYLYKKILRIDFDP